MIWLIIYLVGALALIPAAGWFLYDREDHSDPTDLGAMVGVICLMWPLLLAMAAFVFPILGFFHLLGRLILRTFDGGR